MKTYLKFSVVLFSFIVTSVFQAFGVLPGTSIYEPFAAVGGGSAYAVGDRLTNQICASGAGIWTNANTTYSGSPTFGTNFPTVASGNLSKAGLPTSTGNSVQFGGVGGASRFAIANPVITSGTVYYSLLMKCSDLQNIDTASGSMIAGLNNSAAVANAGQPTVVMNRVILKTNSAAADSYFIGVGKTAVAGDWTFSATSFGTNDVIHIVGGYTFGTPDVNNLWINPDPATWGGASAPAPDITTSAGTDPATQIGSFVIFNRLGTPANTVMDEMRFGTNWASVVPGVAPFITSQPTSVTNVAGATAVFTAVASGPTNLVYQWRSNGVDLADGGNVSGATSASLTLTSVSAADEADYTLVVTNDFGSVTSSIASYVLITAPVITTQPASSTNDATTTATFNVVASGAFNLYQWRSNGVDLADGGNVSGATTDTLTLANVLKADEAAYSVQVTNDAGAVLSDGAATLTVIDPVITLQPQSQLASTGTNVIFNVAAVGTSPFFYQWKKNGSDLSDNAKYSGSATPSLTVSSIVTGGCRRLHCDGHKLSRFS